MLQVIREKAQGWFAWAIITAICIPFALWGINEYTNVRSNVTVAKVGGDDISIKEFEKSYTDYRQRFQSMFGGAIDFNKLDSTMLKRQAMNQLIDTRVLEQYTKSSRLMASDDQVATSIKTLETFNVNGVFNKDVYNNRLKESGLSPAAFENQVRMNLVNEQVRDSIQKSNFIATEEVTEISKLVNQKRSFRYATLPIESYKTKVTLTEEDVKKYYDAHHDLFMTPEQIKIEYLELNSEDIAKTVTVTDEALKSHYEANKASYIQPEQRSVSHILVQVAENATPADIQKAKERAEDYLKQVQSGKPFEQVAKDYSEDAGSKANGGKIDFFTKGVMDPEFEKAAFAMKPGEISSLVRSKFGFHIIRLLEVKPETSKPFEQVVNEIKQEYQKGESEDKFYKMSEDLAALTFEHPDTLTDAAQALGLTVKESGYFAKTGSGEGITADPKVLETAFSPEVLEEKNNSEVIDMSEGKVVVLRLKDHKLPALKKIEEVKPTIEDTLKTEKAQQQLADRVKAILAELNDKPEVSPETQSELKWQDAKEVTREDKAINQAVLREAFKLKLTDEKAKYSSLQLGNGDQAIITLAEIIPGQESDQAKLKQLKEQITAEADGTLWNDLMASLRQDNKIDIYWDTLEDKE